MKSFLTIITAIMFVSGCTSTSLNRKPQQSVDIGIGDSAGQMFKDLKTFRTYFQIQLESKMAEQFEVWYETKDNGWDVFQMAVQADEKFTAIPEDRRLSDHTARAGWPQPPKKVVKPPQALEGVAQRIKNAVPVTFPKDKIKNIIIVYLGQWARVSAYQYSPTAPHDAAKPYRRGRTAERFFFVNTKTGSTKEFGGGSSGGGSLNEPYNQVLPTSWVHVALPKEAEGNPILDLHFFRADEYGPSEIPSCLVDSLNTSEKLMMKAIVKRAREMETGKGLSSKLILSKILLEQSNDPVPVNVEQRMEISGSIYGRSAKDFGNVVDSSLKILAPIKMNQVITHVDAKSGVKLTFNMDLSGGKLSAVAERDGNTAQAETALYEVEAIDVNGQSFLMSDVETVDRIALKLPGSGDVKNYDIFLGRMTASPFLIPTGSSCQ